MSCARAARPIAPALPRRLLFTAAIFAGSFLLFLIQPMMGRMALPRLGGAPAVWNSAMLVYQLLLLAGYTYAHWLTRHSPRRQALIHLSLLAVAALFLPVGLSAATPPSDGNVFLWVPWLFLSSIGPIFFVISAHAPLLQRWFAHTGGENPYPLYAASNLGSFIGLISYPILVEPLLSVSLQRLAWTTGYFILCLLLIGCAFAVWRRADERPREPARSPVTPLPRRSVAYWIWLAFIPSGLMLATSLFITTDIMAMPLLWVLPLGLYLLSFTVAFAQSESAGRLVTTIAPYLLVPAAASLFLGERLPLTLRAAILLVALFAVSIACHFMLYRRRPAPRQLTSFYLALSVGGVLGGLFCALVAPLIFDWTYEYPLLLIAAAATLRPDNPLLPVDRWLDGRGGRSLENGASALLILAATALAVLTQDETIVRYGAVAGLFIGFLSVGSRMLLASTVVAVMILCGGWTMLERSASPGKMMRTYFGVYTVVDQDRTRQLLHGTTLHGVQLLEPGKERTPTSYYAERSGVGRALKLAPAMFGHDAAISVVGLGAGTLACYRREGQRWTFFELDPAVAQLATDPGRFSFLHRCAPHARIVLGDARLKLQQEPAGAADVLVVDAFSSDAVPMHLLTREAFEIYGRHLKPGGLLLIHISNRHLDLEPVVTGVGGWHAVVGDHRTRGDRRRNIETGSTWVALSQSSRTVDALVGSGGDSFWERSSKQPLLWTDDHSSLLSVLK